MVTYIGADDVVSLSPETGVAVVFPAGSVVPLFIAVVIVAVSHPCHNRIILGKCKRRNVNEARSIRDRGQFFYLEAEAEASPTT